METIDAQVVKSVVPSSQFQFSMSPSNGASGGDFVSVECSSLAIFGYSCGSFFCFCIIKRCYE